MDLTDLAENCEIREMASVATTLAQSRGQVAALARARMISEHPPSRVIRGVDLTSKGDLANDSAPEPRGAVSQMGIQYAVCAVGW